MRTTSAFILAFCSCLTAHNTFAATTSELTLKNGLKIIVAEDHRAPVVLSMVWYKVGSAYETPNVYGVSHALEHMMYKGTSKHKTGEFLNIISNLGGKENAFTTYDYTGYYQLLSANHLATSFELESDRMQNLSLDADEFAKEIKVIKEERYMRTDDNPQGLTFERFMAAAHLATPYHHPIIGWQNDLDHLDINDLRAWYHQWYGPNNAILVIVGDVKPQQVFALADKYFAAIKPIPLSFTKPQSEPPSLGTRTVNVKTPAKVPMLVLGFDAINLKNAKNPREAYALEVLLAILDGGQSARLDKNLVRGQQVLSEIQSSYNPFSLYPDEFLLAAVPAKKHTILEAQHAILAQIDQVKQHLISDQELARVKRQAIAAKVFGLDSLSNQGQQIGSLEAVGLPWQVGEDHVKNLQSVTAQEVQAVAKKYLTAERLTIATLEPLPIDPSHPIANSNLGDANNVH